MKCAVLILTFWQQHSTPDRSAGLIERIALSGRVVEAAPLSERLRDPAREVAPGAPPLLAFRFFDGADRHRFGKFDVMVDDAGH